MIKEAYESGWEYALEKLAVGPITAFLKRTGGNTPSARATLAEDLLRARSVKQFATAGGFEQGDGSFSVARRIAQSPGGAHPGYEGNLKKSGRGFPEVITSYTNVHQGGKPVKIDTDTRLLKEDVENIPGMKSGGMSKKLRNTLIGAGVLGAGGLVYGAHRADKYIESKKS